MRTFTHHQGIAAALRAENIDTDVIIPLQRLMATPRTELGYYALEPLRYQPDGSEKPDFVLNQAPYRKASWLIAGRNFGSGSSREGAVHALDGLGIRVVVAPSFGDIFFSNCTKNGILPVVLPQEQVQRLMQQAERVAGQSMFHADLPRQIIQTPEGESIPFELDPGLKSQLLKGQDEIALTLVYQPRIEAFEARDRGERPWVWQVTEEKERTSRRKL